MINGAHCIIYSTNSEADRGFLKDVLNLPSVDVGQGWLIFGLPPSEIAIHPAAEAGGRHELFLMCPDVEAFVTEMQRRGIAYTEVSDQGWGLLTELTLPGGGKISVYEPRHARPESPSAKAPAPKPAKTSAKSAMAAAKKPAKKAAKAASKKPAKAAPKKPVKAAKKPAKAAAKPAKKAKKSKAKR